MISLGNMRFQILKTFQIENAINHYRKKMFIVFYRLHTSPPFSDEAESPFYTAKQLCFSVERTVIKAFLFNLLKL